MLDAIAPNGEGEDAFFRELLVSTVFAQVPSSDDSGQLRFIQFISPEGETLLPFFTDQTKARQAGDGSAKVVEFDGRTFFELTLGATLVMNPNDRWCKLYPDEVRVLLDGGTLRPLNKERGAQDEQVELSETVGTPEDILEQLQYQMASLGAVDRGYLADIRRTAVGSVPETALIVLVKKSQTERVCRSLIAVLQRFPPRPGSPALILPFDPTAGLPDWFEHPSLRLIFQAGQSHD